MTVNITPPRVQHVTNGVQDTFAFTFRVIEGDDIEVFLGQNIVPESPATFTVNLTVGPPLGQDGGDVVMNVPPLAGGLTIQRRTDRDQTTDYVPFDPFPAETHETGLDKAMMVAQEAFDVQTRVFFAAPGYDPTTALTIPAYDSDKLLQWSKDPDDGLPHRLINSAINATDLATAVADAQAAAAAAAVSAAAALVSEGNAAASAASASADAAAASASAAAALASQGAAAASAAAALVSEGNAATSETNAGISAAAALVSEGNAASSAGAAAASAAAALVSEGNAATSETNAATSESNAATSETNAAASAAAAAASAAVAAFFDVSTFVSAPVVNGVVRHIMSRSATYDFDGIAATGFCNTTPSAGTVFTVDKELLAGGTTNLGTMTFSIGSNDGVWADVAGGDVTFAAGDRIEITAPAALNGIAEVAITFPLLLP